MSATTGRSVMNVRNRAMIVHAKIVHAKIVHAKIVHAKIVRSRARIVPREWSDPRFLQLSVLPASPGHESGAIVTRKQASSGLI